VVNIRKQVFPPLIGERLMACELTDMTWIDSVISNDTRSVMIVMEGVSAYLTAEENEWLFKTLGSRLENKGINVDMIFDFIHPALADSRYVTNKAGGTRMPFRSGFVDSEAVKRLHPTIQVVSEHEVYSRISPRHAMFAMEFEAASRGKRPCSIIHIRFGSHD
jgi:O-methyltransferase involved in polyketide biosynthesis